MHRHRQRRHVLRRRSDHQRHHRCRLSRCAACNTGDLLAVGPDSGFRLVDVDRRVTCAPRDPQDCLHESWVDILINRRCTKPSGPRRSKPGVLADVAHRSAAWSRDSASLIGAAARRRWPNDVESNANGAIYPGDDNADVDGPCCYWLAAGTFHAAGLSTLRRVQRRSPVSGDLSRYPERASECCGDAQRISPAADLGQRTAGASHRPTWPATCASVLYPVRPTAVRDEPLTAPPFFDCGAPHRRCSASFVRCNADVPRRSPSSRAGHSTHEVTATPVLRQTVDPGAVRARTAVARTSFKPCSSFMELFVPPSRRRSCSGPMAKSGGRSHRIGASCSPPAAGGCAPTCSSEYVRALHFRAGIPAARPLHDGSAGWQMRGHPGTRHSAGHPACEFTARVTESLLGCYVHFMVTADREDPVHAKIDRAR